MKANKFSLMIATGMLLIGTSTGVLANDKGASSAKASKSRAEVVAEIKQARVQGQIGNGEMSWYPRQSSISSGSSGTRSSSVAVPTAVSSQNSFDSSLYFGG